MKKSKRVRLIDNLFSLSNFIFYLIFNILSLNFILFYKKIFNPHPFSNYHLAVEASFKSKEIDNFYK